MGRHRIRPHTLEPRGAVWPPLPETAGDCRICDRKASSRFHIASDRRKYRGGYLSPAEPVALPKVPAGPAPGAKPARPPSCPSGVSPSPDGRR